MSRTARLLVTAALSGGLIATSAPSVSAAGCSTAWGSLTKAAAPVSSAHLAGVRAGQHACFDRLVLDLGPGTPAGYTVSYVPHVSADGSGAPVATRGGAALQLVVRAGAHDDSGPTYRPADRRELVPVGGYRTLRQVVWAGDFEGSTTIGVGVRARLPFRVFTLTGPGGRSRVVLDVAHRWS